MKMQYSCDDKTLGGSSVGIHKNSRTICKEKPKIRIIHIVAPEIIKTDTENFRSLVQRLTGKSSGSLKKGKNNSSLQKKKKKKASDNPNAFLSFMHGVNVTGFPLLQFTSNSQTSTAANMPFF
ncbi:hypothetical protein AAHA92_02783 [Salvia divinorum]|uniref:VQ domain-containing protein n=1 Tax=Salvia divinorum TaxID=28513 RepID=A0ABD1IFU9_SALDI